MQPKPATKLKNLCAGLKPGQRVTDHYDRVYEMTRRGNLVRVGVATKAKREGKANAAA